MKWIFIFLLNFLIILGNIEELSFENIEQPFLSELGTEEYEQNKIIITAIETQRKEIDILKMKYKEIESKLVVNQERFNILDKVIADKNNFVDELDEKIENFNIKLSKIESENSIEKNKFQEEIYPKIYKVLGISLGIIIILFLILLSVILYQNNKHKKSIEEWKEILELKKHNF